jgi:hypothetical protein
MEKWHLQLAITLPSLVVFTLLYPIVSWITLVFLCHPVELATGYRVPLVGEPGGIDPGAVFLSALFFFIGILITYYCYSKRYLVSFGLISITSFVAVPYIFSVVSSIIWF